MKEFVGPSNAKIYIVGDGFYELEGGGGRLLSRLLMEAGMIREECRIGHLIEEEITYTKQGGRNFKPFFLDAKCTIARDELCEGKRRVEEDIEKCNPNLVVLLGNIALGQIGGESGIKHWRGSILFSKRIGRKIIPTFHPKEILKAWNNIPLVMFDMRRIREESKSPEYSIEKREIVVQHNFEQLSSTFEMLRKCKRISFDVETDREKGHITSLSISHSPYDSVVIPFTKGSGTPYWSLEEEVQVWKLVKDVMEDERIEKIAQNAQFDIIMFHINPYHIQVKNLVMDTMCGHHTIYPEIAASAKEESGKHRISGGKSLGLLCSIYTRQPYYKHWGQSGDDDTFWKYNGMDSCITYECAEVIEKEMDEFNVRGFYQKYVNPLIPILLQMQLRGILLNQKMREEAKRKYEDETIMLEGKLNKAIGRVMNISSPTQLKELLYNELGLPPQYKRGTTTLTTNEEALQKLAKKYNSPIFDLILAIRGNRKLISTYLSDGGGEDGRMRCAYVIGGTETGRLSSRESVFGTGTNLQNIPPGICRRIFVADPNCLFINVDLKQAEAMVMSYLAEEDKLINLFKEGGDLHKLNASWIFSTPVEKVTDDQRNRAKRGVHALDYGMGPTLFATLFGCTLGEAKKLTERYFSEFPHIKIWHSQIQYQLGKCRTMTTVLGRKRTFFGMWGDALFREAYAYNPQATVADVLNYALIRFVSICKSEGKEYEPLLQNHDAFLCQCPVEKRDDCVRIIKEAFDIPLHIKGRVLTIPIDIKWGYNWDEMEKIK